MAESPQIPEPKRHSNFAKGKGAICPECGVGIIVKSNKNYLSRETDKAYQQHYRECHMESADDGEPKQ